MRNVFITGIFVLVLSGMMVTKANAQQGAGERVGEKIDQGIGQVSSGIRQGWAEIRDAVERMGLQARVYTRLRWDKATKDATIEVEVREGSVAVLKGTAPDLVAKQKAVQLANDTVGVNQVIDELAIAPKLH